MPKLNNVKLTGFTVNADVEFTPEEAKVLGLELPGVQGTNLALEHSLNAPERDVPDGAQERSESEKAEVEDAIILDRESPEARAQARADRDDREADAQIAHERERDELYKPNGLYNNQ